VRVGVIDSGLHQNLLTPGNPFLESFSTWQMAVFSTGTEIRARIHTTQDIARWWLEEGAPDPCWDSCGHGSQVTKTILQNTNRVKILSVQVLDQENSGVEACFLAAWSWLLDQKPDVINFSLGCVASRPDLWATLVERSQCLKVKLIAAAGLFPTSPAEIPGVLAVGDSLLRDHPAGSNSSSSLACAWETARYIKGSSG